MRRFLAKLARLLALPALLGIGAAAAFALPEDEPTVATSTFTNVVTYTVPTVTETVTVTAPTEPPPTSEPTTTSEPPPPNDCTATLAPGGDLSSFVASAGAVACLRGGAYSDPPTVSLQTGQTLKSYPGETATISGTRVVLAGSGQKLLDLRIIEVVQGGEGEAVQISGSGALVEGNELGQTDEHGILINTGGRDATIVRNFIHDVGNGDTLDHGIYVQGSGHRIVRNLILRPSGYGIHLYSSPSNIVVNGNTVAGSLTRNGILVRTSGSGIVVVNNLFARGATGTGGTLHSCGGCTVDTNLAHGGWSGTVANTGTVNADPLLSADFHPGAASPAREAARSDAVFPDLAGVSAPVGAPDLGAYEG